MVKCTHNALSDVTMTRIRMIRGSVEFFFARTVVKISLVIIYELKNGDNIFLHVFFKLLGVPLITVMFEDQVTKNKTIKNSK